VLGPGKVLGGNPHGAHVSTHGIGGVETGVAGNGPTACGGTGDIDGIAWKVGGEWSHIRLQTITKSKKGGLRVKRTKKGSIAKTMG